MIEVNTHLAQQSEKFRNDLGNTEQLWAQQLLHTKEASQHISNKVCELQNDCFFPFCPSPLLRIFLSSPRPETVEEQEVEEEKEEEED